MTPEEIRALTIEGVEQRIAAIRTEMESESADIDALTSEVDALEARRTQLHDMAQRRAQLRNRVAAGTEGTVTRSFPSDSTGTPEQSYNRNSPEYRTAWLKNMAVRDGVHLLGEMTKQERAAYTMTTANTAAPVPTEIMNRIVDLVQSSTAIYSDATKSGMTSGFAIPRIKSIKQGDAKETAEGVANDDEQDTWDQLSLDGVEIKKHLVITRKMTWQSIAAFETWIAEHLARRIGNAKDKRCITQLDSTTYGIDTDNVLTDQAYDDAAIRGIMAKVKEEGVRCVYANSNTVWNGLFGIQDANKRPIFLPDQTGDPKIAGYIYGAAVKIDENVADNTAYVGVPSSLLANNFEELCISNQQEAKTFNTVVGGYSLFDAGLENPKAFVKVTFKTTGE